MKLKLPKHFQERMVERDIDVDDIKNAIETPDKKKTVFEGRIVVTKKVGHKTIEVVYYTKGFREKKDEHIVITAYYL